MKHQPRHIRYENIRIGDTIRWTEKHGDLEYSTVGTVAKRDHTPSGTEYLTKTGQTIGVIFRDGLNKPTITLLKPATQDDPPIEGFDKLLEEVRRA